MIILMIAGGILSQVFLAWFSGERVQPARGERAALTAFWVLWLPVTALGLFLGYSLGRLLGLS